MNVSKTAISIAVSTLMVSGAAWADSYDADVLSDNETYVDASTTNSATESFNTDTSLLSNNTDNSMTDNSNTQTTDADFELTSTNTDNSITDSGNTQTTDTDVDLLSNNTDNSTTDNSNVETTDTDVDLLSNNTDNSTTDNSNVESTDTDVDLLSNNTDNSAQWNNSANTFSNDESYELTIDSDIVVASSSLSGTVSGVGVEYDGGGFFSAGVSVNNMNTLDGMNSAAGIVTVSQNSGANSLTQQAVTTNASLFTD